ncbi:MAG: prenyltransferase/squalene oxidase repeat-containing protein [Planctomycetaceae bacterium]
MNIASAVVVRLFVTGLLTFALRTAACAGDANSAIDRGLAFLAKDAVAWRDQYKCASCHHAGLIVLAMNEAKQVGHTVDEPVLTEMTKWLTEAGTGKTSLPRPEGIPKGLNTKPIYYALGLESNPAPDEASTKALELLLATVKEDQTENGSWAAWPNTRPPIFGFSDENMTLLALLSLVPATAKDETAKTAVDKGVQWLSETKTSEDAQSLALRVILWRRVGRPPEESKPWADIIASRQNADGGWSQTPELASDAWATGQALYALMDSGSTAEDESIRRGVQFLIDTQREDGSWAMTSRPAKPEDPPSKNLMPIIGGGSAWGVLGLSRTQRK